MQPAHVHEMLREHASRTPDQLAVLAPGRAPLTYGMLYRQLCEVTSELNARGLGHNDPVAVILPNGPEMAVTFVSLAACVTSAPLNPTYKAQEFDFYLGDLGAKAVITMAGMDSPVREVARARGLPVLDLNPQGHAGLFTLEGDAAAAAVTSGFAPPDAVSLVLHTSGTTSRPKIVPLTQANICASADHIVTSLALTPDDRCLNVMPLFHIHGLMAATLSSLQAGASIVCTPGFDAEQFFTWIDTYVPTWYTAVPTMHQAILTQAPDHRETIARHPLRFIRSSSAALPPQVLEDLERQLGAPVIEAYGMTEASHLMASNPLPPRTRKTKSVGVAAGPDVAIMDQSGTLLARGVTGEIVIRGPNVMHGYQSNPTANATAFVDGWFRTGDQGFIDTDGYLFLTGRLKEIINRGGEKVSPREVDEILLDHPAVAQVVTFAIPHDTLGEDVGAAVVLGADASVTEAELRQFALSRLAGFKVPSRVVVVDEIPKGPTGKLQRIGLFEKLASHFEDEFVAPTNPTEEIVADAWARALRVEHVGIDDNVFMLGADSLMAARVFAKLAKHFKRDLPLATLFESPTVRQLADVLQRDDWSASWRSLVALRASGSRPPLFLVHPPGGEVLRYGALVAQLDADQPVYGLQAMGLDGKATPQTSMEAMAAHYVSEIRTVQPHGPYHLGGFCFGGQVAFEMAQQLHREGEDVALLALFESFVRRTPNGNAHRPSGTRLRRGAQKLGFHARNLATLEGKAKLDYVARRLRNGRLVAQLGAMSVARHMLSLRAQRNLVSVLSRDLTLLYFLHYKAARRHTPTPYPGRITVFLAAESPEAPGSDPRRRWEEFAAGGMAVHVIPGDHDTILTEPFVQSLAVQLTAELLAADQR